MTSTIFDCGGFQPEAPLLYQSWPRILFLASIYINFDDYSHFWGECQQKNRSAINYY